jgi:transposase
MFIDLSRLRIFIKPGATDMRKQQAGLSAVVQNLMGANPFDGSLFLFCNRRRNVIKILYWENNGFCLWMKRLEQDTFPWPRTEEHVREITEQHLRLLLQGIDIWKAHQKLQYSIVA